MDDYKMHIFLFFIPLILGNVFHMIIVKFNWLSELAIPISNTMFGKNKTYRGMIVLPILTGFFTLLLSNGFGPFQSALSDDIIIGLGLGLSYILSELPNSYIKRRFGIANGEQSEKYKYLQYFTDKADSILGVLAFYFIAVEVSFYTVLTLFCLSMCLHIGMSQLLVLLKIKKTF